MLKLYHTRASVCTIKVRLGLAEKGLEWESHLLNFKKGEQFDPEYLKLNPNAVVPTLIHDNFIVIESSIILEYLDSLSDQNILMPEDLQAQTLARIWLLRCLDIHAAINTMTFSTIGRERFLAAATPEKIEASIAQMPSPLAAAKRRDLLENGINSAHCQGAFYTLKNTLDDMSALLENGDWLTGSSYGIVDTAVLSYIDRLERLGMDDLWVDRTPKIGEWLKRSQARASYSAAMDPFVDQKESESTRQVGESLWPGVQQKWLGFLDNRP